MKQEYKYQLQKLLLQHKELDISDQIDFDSQHLKADIEQYVKSVVSEMVNKDEKKKKMVDILPFMTDKDKFSTEIVVSKLRNVFTQRRNNYSDKNNTMRCKRNSRKNNSLL